MLGGIWQCEFSATMLSKGLFNAEFIFGRQIFPPVRIEADQIFMGDVLSVHIADFAKEDILINILVGREWDINLFDGVEFLFILFACLEHTAKSTTAYLLEAVEAVLKAARFQHNTGHFLVNFVHLR